MADLTDKQQAFIDYYLQCLNATEAARLAGYNATYESLRRIGSQNLTKPKIRAAIDTRLKQQTMKADEVLFRLHQQAEGLPPECFHVMGPMIGVDFEMVKKLGLTHLLKEISYDSEGRAKIKLYDAQNALVQLGKFYALFTEKIKYEDWRSEAIEYIRNGELPYKAVVDELGPDLATELFARAGVPITMGETESPD